MARIIWRRVRSEFWMGSTVRDPSRWSIAKMVLLRGWSLTDLKTGRTGTYKRLMDAKSAAETMK